MWIPAVKKPTVFFFQGSERVRATKPVLELEVSNHLVVFHRDLPKKQTEVSPKLLARTRGQSVTLSSPQDFFAVVEQ